jgi:hypothetical protein
MQIRFGIDKRAEVFAQNELLMQAAECYWARREDDHGAVIRQRGEYLLPWLISRSGCSSNWSRSTP